MLCARFSYQLTSISSLHSKPRLKLDFRCLNYVLVKRLKAEEHRGYLQLPLVLIQCYESFCV